MDKARESIFQRAIADYLTGHGWVEGSPDHYDRTLALYPDDLIGYIRQTQPEVIDRLTKFYHEQTEAMLLKRAAEQMDKHGALHVLRHGFKDRGARVRLCRW